MRALKSLMALVACAALWGQFASKALSEKKSQSIEVKGTEQWTDSAIDVVAGTPMRISASGTMQYPDGKSSGPRGQGRSFRDLVRTYPVNGLGKGAIIARIGDGQAFLIGESFDDKAPVSGRLFLGLNEGANEKAEGAFTVMLEMGAAPAPVDLSTLKLPAMTQALLDSIPTRVQGMDGTPGDRVNFLIIGSEQKMKDGFKAGGWVLVDKDVKNAVLAGLVATLSRQAYVTMPMSELMLFNRSQDYGYAQGDPVKVVATRHHFRVWKAPFDLDGSTVFVGAGTHDIGFDKDQRNGKLTHKIDPDTDQEREFIGKSLQNAGVVAKLDYMTASKTVTKAKTAHGEEFTSDGRTLIVYLIPDTPAK